VLEAEKKRSFRSLKGFAIILLIYVVLAATAFLFYPKGFSPLTNTLAQLGDPKLNPTGAIFYNIGVFVICGSTFFIVFALLIGPKYWLTSRGATRKTVFYLTLSFMFLFTLFFLLTVLVPSSTNYGFNSLISLFFLAFLELFVAGSATGIRRLKDHVRWIPWFGFAVVALNLLLVVASIITALSIFSWLMSVLSWSYMLAFIYEFSSATNESA
jgi:hypothetical protein